MTDNDINTLWDYLVNHSVATQDELELITSINGYSIDTLNDVIYARTGYRNLEQLQDEMEA